MAESDGNDIVILGAGPAGAAGALFAANAGLSVAACDRSNGDSSDDCFEWMPPAAREAIGAAGADAAGAVAASIQTVRFVDVSTGRNTVTELEQPCDLVDVGRLTEIMLKAARKRGATIRRSTEFAELLAGEDTVVLQSGNDALASGSVALVAHGAAAAAELAGRRREKAPELGSCCEVVVPASQSGGKHDKDEADRADLLLILDTQDPAGYGYAFTIAKKTIVGMVATVPVSDSVGAFKRALERWKRNELLPRVDLREGSPRVRLVPRGVALEMETHVGKRTLSIGDAGGFVSALSHDGLLPSIQSARIAVEVVGTALASDHLQDALADFDSRWRHELVDYLRLPNTDLRFLIPLAFSNKLMAQRLAMAFLAGGNI